MAEGADSILTKAWRPPLQCRQWSVLCLGDTNTCGIRNVLLHFWCRNPFHWHLLIAESSTESSKIPEQTSCCGTQWPTVSPTWLQSWTFLSIERVRPLTINNLMGLISLTINTGVVTSSSNRAFKKADSSKNSVLTILHLLFLFYFFSVFTKITLNGNVEKIP